MTFEIKKYLLIEMHGTRYAFDLSKTVEVTDPAQLWQIPNSSSHYCGAMNFHNSIVAVMDLAAVLDLPPVSCHDKVIILDQKIAALAFMIERVVRIMNSDEVTQSSPSEKPFIQADLSTPEGTVFFLDIEDLIRFACETI